MSDTDTAAPTWSTACSWPRARQTFIQLQLVQVTFSDIKLVGKLQFTYSGVLTSPPLAAGRDRFLPQHRASCERIGSRRAEAAAAGTPALAAAARETRSGGGACGLRHS